jgi:CDP-diglyceride synthetase
VDNGPDQREDDVTRTDVPVTRPEPSGPVTDRVRIVGAEPAGESTAELPAVPGPSASSVAGDASGPAENPEGLGVHDGDDLDGGQPSVRLTAPPADQAQPAHAIDPVEPGETAVPSGAPSTTELPHWTEPATGQVPAVLARDSGDESAEAGTGMIPPTWREEDADWVAHEEEFEPSMFGGDHVPLGSLDETDASDAERRPWEFDLESDEGVSTIAPITEPVEAVVSEPAGGGGEQGDRASVEPGTHAPTFDPGDTGIVAVAGAGAGAVVAGSADDSGHGVIEPVAAGNDLVDDELFETEKPKPTGSARQGRARRTGLLPGRLRAKRPEDSDALVDAPLAAEPPGASVTDVPGAGRKRGGVAGLAAADRTAERESDQRAEDSESATDAGTSAGPSADALAGVSATVATAGTVRRRSNKRSPAKRGTGSDVPGASAPTGGGPPAPRRSRNSGPPERERGGPGIGLRVGTGVAVAVIALVAFKLGTVTSLVLVLVVATFAAGECFAVLRRAGYHPATLLGLVGTISLMIGAYSKGIAALPLVLVLIVVFTLVWYLFGIERGSPVAGTAATLLTVGWVSLLGSYAGLLLSPSTFPNRHGIAFLLGAIIATVANDVGALTIGGWLGSRALAPTISPNKTWEGLFGGAVFSILFSTVVVGAIHPWTPANAALLGVVVAVVAPIGDLCESLLKRDLRLKDMGTLLPGHGGILDRVDALLFVLPATYYLVRALNIV